MGGLMLLREAWAAKLMAEAGPEGGLVVRGPNAAAPLVGRLMKRKQEVLEALAQRERFAQDPRPDLEGDSPLWAELLTRAYDLDGEKPSGLFGGLHGLRCCGAALAVTGDGGRITAGEMSDAEYDALRRKYLLPHREELTSLLHGLHVDAA